MPWKTTALFILCLCCAQCSSYTPVKNSFVERGYQIGKVSVSLENNSLIPDRLAVFDKLGGVEQVEKNLIYYLKKKNLYNNASPIELSLVIDDFRLRSGVTKYFGLWISGNDRLGGLATLIKGNQLLFSQQVQTSGGNLTPSISREARWNNLNKDLTLVLVKYLSKTEIPATPLTAAGTALPQPTGKQKANEEASAESTGKSKKEPVFRHCTVEQILSMKKLNLSDKQIKAACGET